MDVTQIVFETIEEESKNDYPASSMTVEHSFEEVGLDSLSIVTVVIWLEDKLGIEIKEKELSLIKDMKALVEICQGKVDKL